MKFFTFGAFLAILAMASASNDVKERIREHREQQKLDREVCCDVFIVLVTRDIPLFTFFVLLVESHQDALGEARPSHAQTWPAP